MNKKNKPHIIVLGNEKGGAGKTTTAIHIMASLMEEKFSVATIDIDSRQRSFTKYIENRNNYKNKHGINLAMPSHFVINISKLDSKNESSIDENNRFKECLEQASENDFIIIDSPGNDTNLSRTAHSYADTIVTPVNDSFVDLNVLASVNNENMSVENHGVYSEMVWEAKIYKAQRDKGEIDWIVLRNRLTNINAKNKKKVAEALKNFSRRVRCRLADGFSERVIYKELYLQGLTLLDIAGGEIDYKLQVSHIAARQELRDFMEVLALEKKLNKKEAAA